MNLYKLHKDPETLDHHDDAQDKVVHLFWDKYSDNIEELKKREKSIARSASYSYRYALLIKKPFPLGEAAISKISRTAILYADNVLNGRFELAEPTIAKSAKDARYYAEYIINDRFKEGEAAIAKDPFESFNYAKYVLHGRFKEGEEVLKDSSYWYQYQQDVVNK